MTISDHPPLDPTAEAIHIYDIAAADHESNRILIEQGSPEAVAPPQLWLLGIDPVDRLNRAIAAERYDPEPPR